MRKKPRSPKSFCPIMKKDKLSPKVHQQKLLPGDWICLACEMNNFASRSHCLQCGMPGAGAPRPADRPGDWSCPNSTCRYHNFASRAHCYKCKTAKIPQKQPEFKCTNPCVYMDRYSACLSCGTPGSLVTDPADARLYSLFSGGSIFEHSV